MPRGGILQQLGEKSDSFPRRIGAGIGAAPRIVWRGLTALGRGIRALPGATVRTACAAPGAIARGVRAAPGAIARGVRRALAGPAVIVPRAIGAPSEHRKRYVVHATYAMAILIILAWFNNRPGFTIAVAIAVALGLAYIAWGAFRRTTFIVVVMVAWVASTPLITTVTDPGSVFLGIVHELAFGPIFVGLALFSWLCVVGGRERRPALMLLAAWAVAVLGAVVTSAFAREYGAVGAGVGVLLFFAWRFRLATRLLDLLRRRTRVGKKPVREEDSPDEKESKGDSEGGIKRGTQREAHVQEPLVDQLSDLPRGYRVLYDVGVDDATVGAVVVGRTGCFVVSTLDGQGKKLAIGAGGVARRLALGGKALDKLLVPHASAASDVSETVGVEGVVLVAVHDAQFPEGSHGLVGAEITLRRKSQAVRLTLVDASRLAERIAFGAPMLTARETTLVLHRARARLG